jgi:hypothetical protein
MDRQIELFVAVQCVVMGLSHLLHPRRWVEFFVRLRSWGVTGVFVSGFLSLGFGSVIVAFHDVWQGLPVVITVFGWLHVTKGVTCFVFPEIGLRSMNRVSPERSREFVIAGAVLFALGGFSGYLYFRP